jgi:hypothetical protein
MARRIDKIGAISTVHSALTPVFHYGKFLLKELEGLS